MDGETCLFDGGWIFVPEIEIKDIVPEHSYLKLWEHRWLLAVLEGTSCIGYIDVQTLGFPTAIAWEAAQTPTPGTL